MLHSLSANQSLSTICRSLGSLNQAITPYFLDSLHHAYMPRFWLCQILIGLLISFLTLWILSLAVLCYKKDVEGHENFIFFESRQLKAAAKDYSVHDKELLAMTYALVKFSFHLLGYKPFVVYTDHAYLSTATQSLRRGWPVGFHSLQNITSR